MEPSSNIATRAAPEAAIFISFFAGMQPSLTARQVVSPDMVLKQHLYRAFCILAFGARHGTSFSATTTVSAGDTRRHLTSLAMSLEVEQKFQLSRPADLESKLKRLGFVSKGEVKFVDWYFDNGSIELSKRDCWLRFRDRGGRGQWELKRGRGHDGATVYEEIEGDKACIVAVDILKECGDSSGSSKVDETSDRYREFQIPKFPLEDTFGLQPFCRLETTRSSWSAESGVYAGLSVDLDAADTGHTVGEVEMLCDDSELENGRHLVQKLVSELTGGDETDSTAVIGKLEHYLLNNRPEHYETCVNCGILQRFKPS